MALAAAATLTVHGKKKQVIEPSYAWQVMPPLGLQQPATIDTNYIDYSLKSVPSEVSSAYATTGNLGAEGINMIYFERPSMSDFFFRDALDAWIPSLSTLKFYNTRIPMTLMSYNFGGGKEDAQERLHGIFSGNINRRAQIGAYLDYIYSKGSYNYQATKDLTWGASGSYMGDRYEFQGSFFHYNFLNKENGGITDDRYITDPAEVQGGSTKVDAKTIPTNLSSAHSKVVGTKLWLNNRYKVGYWHEEQVNDTTVKRTYIPVTSFVWTFRYDEAKHLFLNSAPGEAATFFEHTYLDNAGTRDRTTYWAVSNTVGVSLLEGFHKYAKAGLGAYLTHQYRKYHQTLDTIGGRVIDLAPGLTPYPIEGQIKPSDGQNLVWVGAQLTKQRGSLLTYDATTEFGLMGDVAADIKVNGRVSTRLPLLRDSVTVTAYGRFSNTAAPYLTENYVSNHFIWHNDFGKERRYRVGGIVDVPLTRSQFNVGFENIQNLIYFNDMSLPAQYGDNIQVLSAQLMQRLKYRALHWDNRITFQTTSKADVLPLPKLAWYSNLYVTFKVARVLDVQLGVDCDYYTRYKAYAYQPATMTFHTQSEAEIGNYPFMNAYINFKLSKTRFYVMMSHFNQGLFGGDNYFSMPNYPLNPRRLQLGLSVDFAN